MAEEMIYRPREMYEKQLKKQYHEEAIRYFNELVEKAKVDEQANAMHVKEYNKKVEIRKEKEKALNKVKAGKGWAIVGIVLGGVLAVTFLVLCITGVVPPWGWALVAGGLAVVGLMIFLLATRIKNAMQRAKEALAKAQAEEQAALKVCYDDLAVLNSLYDWNMPHRIMTKVTPILQLDEHYTAKRDAELHDIYGLVDDECTTLQVLSGSIMQNPFILERVYEREIKDKEYVGTLTITWTTTYRDSKGNSHTQTHTQTLRASAFHPAPFFYKSTRLIYGNEAAPDLSFTRRPNPNSALEGKALDNYVKKRAKELAKKEKRDLTDNNERTNFKTMGNEVFDALFDATDRNHEVQFRLLFTALAQTNMVDLLTTKEPYGDDFVFYKDKKINSISSGHSQGFNYVADPSFFIGYDCAACRNFFVDYCDKFLRGLYFDLAPLISIPLYQMHRPAHSFLDENAATWLPRREHEVLANSMDPKAFLPKDADPSLPVYLTEVSSKKNGSVDSTVIHSSSFHTTPMTDYIPVRGGDGRVHSVPVHWIKYDEVHDDFNIGTVPVGGTQNDYRQIGAEILNRYGASFRYQRGLLGFFTGKDEPRMERGDFEKYFHQK